jgi:hypothetical protein
MSDQSPRLPESWEPRCGAEFVSHQLAQMGKSSDFPEIFEVGRPVQPSQTSPSRHRPPTYPSCPSLGLRDLFRVTDLLFGQRAELFLSLDIGVRWLQRVVYQLLPASFREFSAISPDQDAGSRHVPSGEPASSGGVSA